MLMRWLLGRGGFWWGLVAKRTDLVIRGLELWVHPSFPQLWGEERSWRLNPSPRVDDLINSVRVMEPP